MTNPSLALVATLARLVLAATFVLAALAKLRQPDRGSTTVAAFGIPRRFAPAVAGALPWAELWTAVLLLWASTARAASVAAAVLLTCFTIAVAVNLAQRRRPPCGCFGASSRAPIGVGTLLRNLVLLALACAALAVPPVPLAAIASRLPHPPALAILAALACAITLLLWMRRARLLLRLDAAERASQPGVPASTTGEQGTLAVATPAPHSGFRTPPADA